jgi:hypothetical protein
MKKIESKAISKYKLDILDKVNKINNVKKRIFKEKEKFLNLKNIIKCSYEYFVSKNL